MPGLPYTTPSPQAVVDRDHSLFLRTIAHGHAGRVRCAPPPEKVTAMLLLLFSLLSCPQSSAPPPKPAATPATPHIILILADDLGIGDPACYNAASKIPTPNMDRLADEGLRLTDAHSPSAVCTPTRYALLTGRNCWRTWMKQGVLWSNSPNLIERERTTLPDLLRSRGYRNLAIGKWHLGLGEEDPVDWKKPLRPGPLEHGFDHFFGIAGSLDMAPYIYLENDAVVQAATEVTELHYPRRNGGDGFWRAGGIARDFRHDQVLDRITQEAESAFEGSLEEDPERPVFLYFALTAPHTPWVPTRAFHNKSGAGWYGDFVAQVDHALGSILAMVDRLELSEETLVIFTSDNGAHWEIPDIERYGHLANDRYRGQKADIWEGGHRVPFFVRWPGKVPAGEVRGELFGLVDLWATLAAIVGAEIPAGEGQDSLNQSALLLGEELDEPVREELVHHSFEGMFALRRGPWKLIEGRGSGGFTDPAWRLPAEGEAPGRLHHLGRDPSEQKNLWDEEPEVVARLLARLAEIRADGDDSSR